MNTYNEIVVLSGGGKMDEKYSALFICAVILFLYFVGASSALTWYVDDDGRADFTEIQDAIYAASAGDTIIVRNGTYHENIAVCKRLTIRSENGSDATIVRAKKPGYPVFVVSPPIAKFEKIYTVSQVNISGFTVENALNQSVGIALDFAEYCNISNNNCSNNTCGIYLKNSHSNKISNNTCSKNEYGIYLFIFSKNNSITKNLCSDNGRVGFLINSFSSHSINNNKIYLNNFVNNTANVYSDDLNNIWNSTEEINYALNGLTYTNYLGNYWDDYQGLDKKKDGIGDTPYRINEDKDNYPLMMPFENYNITVMSVIR